ncbi:MAG TPA: helix-turn-helix transcriptional regulator [Candidatus Ornithomonoglobus intestinigallinarum]|uniref:Helix-turn-helix transcriptional regulator n=1 Tax=Candidatus Ornithomonoglobus intestinigallinarum TaxID=2840894 RepID=A0A9D1H405_9FIRM|nr:helix-turn-helix transcriptional regulator [Candidatus Ornithomonoglobus intestinigallinarum]
MEYCGLDMTGVIHNLPRELVYDFNRLHESGCCDMSDTTVGIYRFICCLCSLEDSRARRVSSYESFLRTSFETFAARNLSYGIDVNAFCKKTGISETELDKALEGGVSDTIKKCRISEAKRLLITRPDDLRETICRYCGFPSVSEMEMEFEEYAGASVDEFINSYKQ